MAERVKSNYPSVQNGATPEAMVLRTSVSALTTFDPLSYAGCNRRWYFSRVLGEKEEEKVAQRIGKEGHAQAELYEQTGDDQLGPVMRAGKKFLLTGPDILVETQFGDLDRAIEMRLAGAPVQEIEKVAGLCAGGIPLDGYIDFMHKRGEYIDGDGVLRRENPAHGLVVEVGDHKTTSSIESFAKSPTEMASTIQMTGYANYVLNINSIVNYVRLSHVYYQTRGALLSKKVTALVAAPAAREAWKRVDQLAAKMEHVARLPKIEDVEPNTNSCKAYRGCDYVDRCPITRTFASGGRAMSLFNKTNSSTPTNGTNGATPPPPAAVGGSLFARKPAAAPPATDAAREASVAAEKSKLAAEDAARADAERASKARQDAAAQSFGTCMCGAALNGLNISQLPGGVIKHIGCPRAGVVPADAPTTTPVSAAAPMTAEQIAAIEDAEIRQRAADHAAASAAQAATNPPAQEKTGGRCPQGGQRVLMNDKQKMTRSMACPGCGKDYKKVKDEQIDIQDNGVFWVIPSHNMIKVEAPAPVAAPPAPAPVVNNVVAQQAAQAVAAAQALAPVVPVVPVVESGRTSVENPPVSLPPRADEPVQAAKGVIPLEDYYLPMVRELEENAGAADIRCAPEKSELAFGKWKGALSAYVRMKPPAPGIYITRSNDEIAQEVVNTLRPMCSVGGIMLFIDVAIERDGSVVRGVR